MSKTLTRRGTRPWWRTLAVISAAAVLSAGIAPMQAGAATWNAEVGQGTVTVTTKTVAPGGEVTIVGSGFEERPAEGYLNRLLDDGTINWPDGSRAIPFSATEIEDGGFTVTAELPTDIPVGEHNIRILGGNDGGVQASKYDTFQVIADASSTPAITVGEVAVAADGTVTVAVDGTGFAANAAIAASVGADSAQQQWVVGSGRTQTLEDTIQSDDSGVFSGVVSIAAGAAPSGLNVLSVSDGINVRAAQFEAGVAVAISGDPAQGSEVTASIANAADGVELSGVYVGADGANLLGASVAAASGTASAAVTIPADAAIGTSILIGVTVSGAEQRIDTGSIVTPSSQSFNAENFTITSQVVDNGLYQTVYSAKQNAVYATTAVGRPPVTQSKLLKLDPDTLEVLDEAVPAVADEETGGLFAVYGVGLDDELNQVWVTNTRQNTVAVYDAETLDLIKQFDADSTAHSRDVIVDQTTHLAYVSSANNTYIDVYDTKALEQGERIDLAAAADGDFQTVMSLDLDQATGKLYTVSLGSAKAAVIDTRNGNAVQIFDLGDSVESASGSAVDPATGRLFIASQVTNNLVVLNTETGEIEANVPTGAGALNTAYDAEYDLVYVANRTAGTITVVDGSSYEIVANLPFDVNPNHVETDGLGNVYATNKAPLNDADEPTNVVAKITPNWSKDEETPSADESEQPADEQQVDDGDEQSDGTDEGSDETSTDDATLASTGMGIAALLAALAAVIGGAAVLIARRRLGGSRR